MKYSKQLIPCLWFGFSRAWLHKLVKRCECIYYFFVAGIKDRKASSATIRLANLSQVLHQFIHYFLKASIFVKKTQVARKNVKLRVYFLFNAVSVFLDVWRQYAIINTWVLQHKWLISSITTCKLKEITHHQSYRGKILLYF